MALRIAFPNFPPPLSYPGKDIIIVTAGHGRQFHTPVPPTLRFTMKPIVHMISLDESTEGTPQPENPPDLLPGDKCAG